MLKYKQIWHGIKPIKWLIKFNLAIYVIICLLSLGLNNFSTFKHVGLLDLIVFVSAYVGLMYAYAYLSHKP